MHHSRLWLLALILLTLVPPVAAQDTSDIVDFSDGFLNAFMTVVRSAGMEDTLREAGPFTIFIPANAAFAALGATLDEVNADSELAQQIINYHMVDGALLSDDLVGLPAVTTLEGSDITIEAVGNEVLLNGVATVTGANNEVANGIIHIIDTVLLPPDLAMVVMGEAMVEATVPADAVVEEAMPDDAMTDTEMMMQPLAQVRFAHFASTAPIVDVYVDGVASDAAGLGFNTISGWMSVPEGGHEIALVPEGSDVANAAFGPVNLTLTANTWTTAAAIDSSSGGLAVALINEDFATPLEDGNTRVTVFHSIADGPVVNVTLSNGAILVQNAGYASFGTFDVSAGVYNIQVTPSGDPATVILDLDPTALDAGAYYFVAATGTSAAPQSVWATSTGAEMMAEPAEAMEEIAEPLVEPVEAMEDAVEAIEPAMTEEAG
jgi:hypothetical protein